MNPIYFIKQLDPWQAWLILKPLCVFVAGMVAYGIFVFKFYRFLGRREIFALNLSQYNRSEHPFFGKFFHVLLYMFEYLLLFPLFVFFWFSVIAGLLALLTREQTVGQLLLIAMAVVAAVRITAYYKESLSTDLAKMLPFSLLGVLVLDINTFSPAESWSLIQTFPDAAITAAYYLAFTIFLEWVLRMGNLLVRGTESSSAESKD